MDRLEPRRNFGHPVLGLGKERELSVRFDGRAKASVTGFRGRTFGRALDCDPAEAAE